MKLFTQLALVTAVASCGSAYAMQSIDDSTLADTTGQDGLTITIAPPAAGITINQIALFDKDALGSGGAYYGGNSTVAGNEAGAILIGQHAYSGGAGTGTAFNIKGGSIGLIIDATGGGASGATTGTAPMLNVKVQLPTSLTITTGDIYVAGAQGAAGAQTVDSNNNALIMTSMQFTINNASLNIQLGNPLQGAMMVLAGSVTNGLQIGTGGTGVGGIYLADGTASTGGNIGIQKLTIWNSGSTTTMTLAANIDAYTATNFNTALGTAGTAGGLGISLTAGSNYDVYLQGVTFGGSAAGAQIAGESIGDVKLSGLNLVGTKIGIQGH